MSIYNCKTVSLNKLIFTPNGVLESLCTKCKTRDCENPIEEKTVMFLGIPKKIKVHVSTASVGAVVACDGFVE